MEAEIEQLYNPLFLFIRKRINKLEDAQDLTQEVFLKLANTDLDSINNVKSWVYTIAQNTITDHYRKKKVFTEEIQDLIEEDEQQSGDSVSALSLCVASYIDMLPDEYRDLLRLSELEGLSQKEIAEQTKSNYTTVRSKIQRGRKKLKDIFTACCTVTQGGKGSIMDHTRNSGQKANQACSNESC